MKYIIAKTDGTPVDPNAVYFVLRLDKPTDEGRCNRRLIHMWSEWILKFNPEASKAAMECLTKGNNAAAAKVITNAIFASANKTNPEELNKVAEDLAKGMNNL